MNRTPANGMPVRTVDRADQLGKSSLPQQTSQSKFSQLLSDWKQHGDPSCLRGPEWNDFYVAEPKLAETIQRCAELMASNVRFQNDSEQLFSSLRRNIFSVHRGHSSGSGRCVSLEEVPGKVFVWEFLLVVAARRSFYRNQAAEVTKILESSPQWVRALQ